MANLTLLDIAKMNNNDATVGLIEETIAASPEAVDGSARTIKTTTFKSLIRTGLPKGEFRNVNEGVTPKKSSYAQKLVQTFIMDTPIEVDKAAVDSSEDGAEAVLALEASGVVEGAFRSLSSQFYYGTATTFATADSTSPLKGFPGLQQVVDSTMVLDATGAAAATGASVWAIKWGPKNVQWVNGLDGQVQTGDPQLLRLTDSNGNPYDGWRIPFLQYIGVQLVNKNSVAQIKNLTAEAGKTLTDDLMFELLEKFPIGIEPDMFYMTRRSRRQLRESRTATNQTGTPAPLPTEVGGVPIRLTSGLLETETIV